MVFNSYIFILAFLPIVLTIYYLLNHFKKYNLSKVFLICASLFFYAFSNVKYLIFIISSLLINYGLNKIISRNKKYKRTFFILGLVFNIGLLFGLKYTNFSITIINHVASKNFNLINLLVPIGISFFTFDQIAYLVDTYKGNIKKYKFIDYAAFVTFFPKLLSGPITMHYEMVPQFENEGNKKFNIRNFSKGIVAFSYGFAKKVLIADTFAQVANIIFTTPINTNTTDLILGVLAYTFQIYFDFSGYCDMGIGVGYMFNIELPKNFDSPYKAYSVLEFWKRWHITLTKFFTNYVYIPLGGNRKGTIRTYFNVFIIFLISGLWHGANFTFIVWGILHGIASIIERIFKKQIEKTNIVFKWLRTFLFINVTWIFFRADSIKDAVTIIKNILRMDFRPISTAIIDVFKFPEFTMFTRLIHIEDLVNKNYQSIYMLVFFIFSLFAVLCMKNTNERIDEFKPKFKSALVAAMLFIWSIISLTGVTSFIYFNF